MSCLSKNLNLIKMIFDLFSRKKSDGFLSNKDIQAFFCWFWIINLQIIFSTEYASHICPEVGNIFQCKQTDRHSISFSQVLPWAYLGADGE